jgi:hypothetical protein
MARKSFQIFDQKMLFLEERFLLGMSVKYFRKILFLWVDKVFLEAYIEITSQVVIGIYRTNWTPLTRGLKFL